MADRNCREFYPKRPNAGVMIAYDTKERRDRILNEYALRGEEPRYIKVYDPGKDDWVYILKEPRDIRHGVK